MRLSKDDIDYPRDIFMELIDGNSPYAFYLFQWVPYQSDAKLWRLKLMHDVKTFDGREAHRVWPNGGNCGPFKDEEVEFIRISRRQFGEEWKHPRDVPNAALTGAPDKPKQSRDVSASGSKAGYAKTIFCNARNNIALPRTRR